MKVTPSSSSYSDKYFPSVDGLRFVAFLMVFVSHFLLTLQRGSYWDTPFFSFEYLWVGVDLFFCISGFVITHTLNQEYSVKHKINVLNFYIRRALKIWPLYFTYVGVIFFIFSQMPFFLKADPDFSFEILLKEHLAPYLFFYSNFSIIEYGYPKLYFLGHLWTISLEEQFYIIFPFVYFTLRKYPKKALLILILALIALPIMRIGFYEQNVYYIYTNTYVRLDSFIYGILIAIYLDVIRKQISSLFSKMIILCVWLICFRFLTLAPGLGSLEKFEAMGIYSLIGVFSGIFLIMTLAFEKVKMVLSFRPFKYLGQISYGLYVYHIIPIYLFQKVRIFETDAVSSFLLSLILTIMMASLSYHLFEKKFLKLKNRFSN